MKYDDASWHYGGKFPKDLPPEAGATHTGMFVAWALLNGLAGEIYSTDFPDQIPKLVSRSLTPGRFFLEACDGKFTDDDSNEEGNAFAQAYFDFEKGHCIADYEGSLGKSAQGISTRNSWSFGDYVEMSKTRRGNVARAVRVLAHLGVC